MTDGILRIHIQNCYVSNNFVYQKCSCFSYKKWSETIFLYFEIIKSLCKVLNDISCDIYITKLHYQTLNLEKQNTNSYFVISSLYHVITSRYIFIMISLFVSSKKINQKKKIDNEKIFHLIHISPQPGENFPQIICT